MLTARTSSILLLWIPNITPYLNKHYSPLNMQFLTSNTTYPLSCSLFYNSMSCYPNKGLFFKNHTSHQSTSYISSQHAVV